MQASYISISAIFLLKNDDKQPSTDDSFPATIAPASTKMRNRLYPAEPEGHWRIG